MSTVECPAGLPIAERPGGGRGCLCRVESSTAALNGSPTAPVSVVDEMTSPVSLVVYCEAPAHSRAPNGRRAGYDTCPTWRAERERRAAKRLADD